MEVTESAAVRLQLAIKKCSSASLRSICRSEGCAQTLNMGQIRIPPQYLSVGSLGFVAGWMSRGGEGLITHPVCETVTFSCGLYIESGEDP